MRTALRGATDTAWLIRRIGTFQAPGLMVAIFGLSLLSACGSFQYIERPPVEFSESANPRSAGEFPNWPVPPAVIETTVLQETEAGRFEIREAEATARGMTGARRDRVYFPKLGKEVTFKFKAAPWRTLDGFNNSPRREIAAYQIQKLFLDPEDYVVPTTFLICLPPDKMLGNEEPNFNVLGAACTLGNASTWLNDLKLPDVALDNDRFVSDPTYAYFMSNFNILAYLINHKDAVEGNILVSNDDTKRQVFSIDNGLSFDAEPHNFFFFHFNYIRVPAVRADSIERLRQLKRSDLDFLGVVAELRRDNRAILLNVEPGPNLDPNLGVRQTGDGTVQFGLRKKEIDDLWGRIQDLVVESYRGEIPTF